MGNKEELELQDWGGLEEHSQRWQARAFPINKENKLFYLIVVCALAATTLLTVVGSIVLTYMGKEIPSALVALGSVAVGALGSLFTHK
jgi:hypothetical protein